MKTRLTILTLGLLLITVFSTKAQIGFGVELYGGTQLSHLDVNSSVPETLLFVSSPLDVHFGGDFSDYFSSKLADCVARGIFEDSGEGKLDRWNQYWRIQEGCLRHLQFRYKIYF
jgi:hypothetical protein